MEVTAFSEAVVLREAAKVSTGQGGRCRVDWEGRQKRAGFQEFGVKVNDIWLGATGREKSSMPCDDIGWAGGCCASGGGGETDGGYRHDSLLR